MVFLCRAQSASFSQAFLCISFLQSSALTMHLSALATRRAKNSFSSSLNVVAITPYFLQPLAKLRDLSARLSLSPSASCSGKPLLQSSSLCVLILNFLLATAQASASEAKPLPESSESLHLASYSERQKALASWKDLSPSSCCLTAHLQFLYALPELEACHLVCLLLSETAVLLQLLLGLLSQALLASKIKASFWR